MKSGKKAVAVSRLSISYLTAIIAANVLLPLLMLLVASRKQENGGWIIFLFFIVIIMIHYLLVIRPIRNIESVLCAQKDEEYITKRLKRLERGTGLERVFYKIYREQHKNVEREYRSELLRQEAQLMALQSQMNPHFLFNTLECIRGYAVMHKITDVANMTEALAKMSRRMTASSSKIVALKQEIQLVENYMTIQRFRFRNKFTLNTKIDDKTLYDHYVLNLLLQPIVENAVVHGVKGKKGEFAIHINAYKTEKRLIIRIQDNGCGISAVKLAKLNQKLNRKNMLEQIKESNDQIGIALPNINQRIKLYMGEEYGLHIMSTEAVGTTVEIILPLLHQEEIGYEA